MSRRSCHKLVKQTAQEMAGVMFEEVMKDNARWEAWQYMCQKLTRKEAEKRFIALMWPNMIEQARKALAELLNTNMDEGLKDVIATALIQDNFLRPH